MEHVAAKRPADSAVTMVEPVLPQHANILGNALGGQVMHWMDMASAIAAYRHSRKQVVTVAVDSLHFHYPVRVGMLAVIDARLTWVGRSSMEVRVGVAAEDPKTGETRRTTSAYFTFVALDGSGRPSAVPPLTLTTEAERAEAAAAGARRAARLREASQKPE